MQRGKAGRIWIGTETGCTKAPEKSGEKKCAKWYGIVVSADGFEPSTHALKGRRLRVLPRGTNDLAYQTTVQIGAKHPQSAVNLQLIYIRAQGFCGSVGS